MCRIRGEDKYFVVISDLSLEIDNIIFCTSRILVTSSKIHALFIFIVISGRIVCNVVNPGCRVSMW